MNKKIIQVLKSRGLSKMQLSLNAKISPADLYQALSGKKPFFPAWRRRVSEVLGLPEDELFPEYEKREG